MIMHTEQQEIGEANLRASRAEMQERWGLQTMLTKWLKQALAPEGATHLLLGSSGMRAAEALTQAGGRDTNIIVVEDNMVAVHDLVNDFALYGSSEAQHAVFVHLFDLIRQEHGKITRIFQCRAPLIQQMRKHRRQHKNNVPHVFIISDTPSGEATSTMLEDALVDSASYDGSTVGLQRLILDAEAGEALGDRMGEAYELQGKQGAIAREQAQTDASNWFYRRAAYTAHAYLKEDAPFIVHGSIAVHPAMENVTALRRLRATALEGMHHLWEARRQIAIRLLDKRRVRDPHGHNLLYALELLRRDPTTQEMDAMENEHCTGK